MYYYFSSDFPAVIKINGIYYGSIQNTVKPLRFDDDNETFIEICPLIKNENPTSFIIPSDFLFSPPDSVTVTDLKGGYLIKILKSFNGGEFKVLSQSRLSSALVTVFNENGLKVSIETANDFFVEPIPIQPKTVEVTEVNICGANLIAVILLDINDENTVLLYSLNNGAKQIFMRTVKTFSFENGFSTTETLCDIAKHEITVFWEFSNNQLSEKSRRVNCKKNITEINLPDKLLPYAFVEELFVSGNYTYFLSDNIKENADKLPEYLGSFIGVMPPPTFRDVSEVGLIYPNGKNKYKVEYFIFEIEKTKICNIKRSTD